MTPPENYLFRNLVFGHFVQYRFTLAMLFCFQILLLLALRSIPRQHFREQTESFNKETRSFRRSYFLSLWLTIVGYLYWTWLLSVYKESPNAYRIAGFVIAAAAILLLTFVLEGLEIAFTDLRDKDPDQIGVETFKHPRRMSDSFYEAREWAVVLLLVITTLLIENHFYELPYLAHADDVQNGWGKILRIVISVVLTTFPFVWFAQSPGKAVARSNSLGFVTYKGSQFVAQILQAMRRWLGIIGLQFPSEEAEDIAFGMLKLCRSKRNLPPSEFSFFADALKKYGCGTLCSTETMIVRQDGSCEFISSAIIYVSSPRKSVRRYCAFESPFVRETIERLEKPRSEDSRYWAYRAPVIGERVTEKDLQLWNSLLCSDDPEIWSQSGYNRSYKNEFQVSAEVIDPAPSSKVQDRPTYRLNIKLGFPKEYPEKSVNKGGTESLIILWRFRVTTEGGTVLFPTGRNARSSYPFSKRYSLPGLRSTMKVQLEGDANRHYRFDYPASFAVNYEGVKQSEEQERFEAQERVDAPSKIPQRSNERKSLVFYVDSPLPAGDYTYTFHLNRDLLGEEVLSQLTAGADEHGGVAAASEYGGVAAASEYGGVAATSEYGDVAATSEYGKAITDDEY